MRNIEAVFHAETPRQALKPIDPSQPNAKPRLPKHCSKWEAIKDLICPEDLDLTKVAVKAFQQAGKSRKARQHTSNSKYFVIKREKKESHEDAELATALAEPPPQPASPPAALGTENSKLYLDGAPKPHHRRRMRQPPKAALDDRWGLQMDPLCAQMQRLDVRTVARRNLLTPVATAIPAGAVCQAQTPQGMASSHHCSFQVGPLDDSRRIKASFGSLKEKSGHAAEWGVAPSEAGGSDDGGGIREEDAIHIPADVDLEAMPINDALAVMLAAQQRIIKGLGRVEEPWNVRLQRKHAAIKALFPNKANPRVPLFEANATEQSESPAYTKQRHAYLLAKITELRRKLKMIALRQEQHLASVSDVVEMEKRHMLMQVFDLEREERRLRLLMRRMEDNPNSVGHKTKASHK